jgi:hypothetical protein
MACADVAMAKVKAATAINLIISFSFFLNHCDAKGAQSV